MNILVCMKQVPDDSVEIHLNADGAPDLANVTPVVNAFDTYALEMAARLKESSEGEITIVCVGEEGAKMRAIYKKEQYRRHKQEHVHCRRFFKV